MIKISFLKNCILYEQKLNLEKTLFCEIDITKNEIIHIPISYMITIKYLVRNNNFYSNKNINFICIKIKFYIYTIH